MKKNNSVRSVVGILCLLITFFMSWAQEVVVQPAIPVVVPVLSDVEAVLSLKDDPGAVTNRAALASLAIRHVDNILVRISDGSNANPSNRSGIEEFLLPYTNTVKSWQGMVDMVNNMSFGISVVDTTKPVQVSVGFYQGQPPLLNNGGYYSDKGQGMPYQVLFQGWNENGTLVPRFGVYVLEEKSSHVAMLLDYNIRVSLPGVIAGKMIINADQDYAWAEDINASNDSFDLSVRAIGTGTLIVFGKFDGEYRTVAISLVTGQEVPIKDAWIKMVLEGEDHVMSFTDPSAIAINIKNFGDYGIVPLIVVKNTIDQRGGLPQLPLTVSTRDGRVVHGYTVINIVTGDKWYVPTQGGSNKVMLDLQVGEYHIIPDIGLKTPDTGGV